VNAPCMVHGLDNRPPGQQTDLHLALSLVIIIFENPQSWNSAAWRPIIKHPQALSCKHPGTEQYSLLPPGHATHSHSGSLNYLFSGNMDKTNKQHLFTHVLIMCKPKSLGSVGPPPSP
jgi:hypothetical protein